MKTIEELKSTITLWESEEAERGFAVDIRNWGNWTFSDLIDDCIRFGVNPFTETADAIYRRIDNWATFSGDGESEEYLSKLDEAYRIIDDVFPHLEFHDICFRGKTVEQVLQQWKDEEEWEKEEEARQYCIEFCANMAYNDGLCETLEEAYDIAEMCV